MTDLNDFLRARLADDELAAPLAAEVMALRASTAEFGARLLREVQAKRRILDWLDETERFMDRDDMTWHRLAGAVDVDHARRLLALPYSDHADYRPEWRP